MVGELGARLIKRVGKGKERDQTFVVRDNENMSAFNKWIRKTGLPSPQRRRIFLADGTWVSECDDMTWTHYSHTEGIIGINLDRWVGVQDIISERGYSDRITG